MIRPENERLFAVYDLKQNKKTWTDGYDGSVFSSLQSDYGGAREGSGRLIYLKSERTA